jgi:hypothetical protein
MAEKVTTVRFAMFAALALFAAGCAAGVADGFESEYESEFAEEGFDECLDGRCDTGTPSVPRVSAPNVFINDPAVLSSLENNGFSLANAFSGDDGSTLSLSSTSPRFESLVRVVEADIAEFKAADRSAGVGLAYSHRLFDVRWLRSAAASFKLVAVTNRIDEYESTPGSCGEVRFVYRLMYSSRQGSSRLPMTLIVAREQPTVGGYCTETARKWTGVNGTATGYLRGPLAGLKPASRIELNLQSVRWPAVARSSFGGYAEYLMRVLKINATDVTPQPLKNTISPTLTAAQKTELAQWIRDNLAKIDTGHAVIPTRFLATRAISVSPRGLARGANRPFLAAYPNPEQTFGSVDFSSRALIKSPAGLVRRLDTMTCQGCHQSRGLAGFHILGQEGADGSRTNGIEVGSSPHLNDELAWRQTFLTRAAAGYWLTTPRPFAERVASVAGKYGAHCALDSDASFSAWTCASGYKCADLNGEEIGVCVKDGRPGAGDACETSSVTYSPDSLDDAVQGFTTLTCGTMPSGRAGYCNHSGTRPHTPSQFGGFPNGSCSGRCSRMGVVTDDAICGAQPPNGFNDCIGRGKPFEECLANASAAYRRRCDAQTPCGDDYVCASVPGAPSGVGACMPPYFVFQVRVDGHP